MCPEEYRHRGKRAQGGLTRPCRASGPKRFGATARWFGHGEPFWDMSYPPEDIEGEDAPRKEREVEQEFEKWLKWLEAIYRELQGVLIQRQVFWSVQDIIKANPKLHKPSAFYGFLGNAYASLGLTVVRRLTKAQKDSVSLTGILKEIKDNPTIMNRERYVFLFNGGHISESRARCEFDHICGGTIGDHIDPKVVQAELDEIAKKSATLEMFVDRKVAHLDKRALTGDVAAPTFKELDDCLDYLEELVKKYWLLFTAKAVSSITPTFQYDWQEIFSVPWIDPSDQLIREWR